MPTPTSRPPALMVHFDKLEDPRIDRTRRHSMEDILVLSICGFVCGIDTWVELEEFAEIREDWFRSFLELPNGIPSHDTFGRFFAALDPEAFSRCFASWMAAVAEKTDGEVVAIDGKTLRRSFDRASSRAAIHMVSAWASENGVVLGQVRTDEKSNEVTAIPRLLELLDLHGCIVTLDAMGCQKPIVKDIVDKGADYVISLKGNQGTLHDGVRALFSEARAERFETLPHVYTETLEKGHGRLERRRYWLTHRLDSLSGRAEWCGLTSVGMVEATREVDGTTSTEVRYFISSLDGSDAEKFARAVRKHWTVENSLHWVLDVTFNEDASRVRKDNAPENVAMLRHVALNLLKKADPLKKTSLRVKRKKASWSPDFLCHVLGLPNDYRPRLPSKGPRAAPKG